MSSSPLSLQSCLADTYILKPEIFVSVNVKVVLS